MRQQINFETFAMEQQAYNNVHIKYIWNQITSISLFHNNDLSDVWNLRSLFYEM